MRVAVTGARGFLGGHVLRLLAELGHDALALGRGDDGCQRPLDAADGSASLAEVLAGCDAVVHLAGRSVDSLSTPLASYLGPNVALSEEIAVAAAEAGVGRVVFTSSRMVYPGHLTAPLHEDLAAPADSFYGLSKRMAEEVLALHGRRTHLTTVSLRVAQVVGDGDGGRGALPRLVELALAGGPVTLNGAGAMVRDFVEVRDVARAIALALTATLPGDGQLVANIGTGGFSVREMADEIARQCGLPDDAVTSRPVEDEDTSVYRLDCTRARTVLGWTPDFGLAEMVRDRVSRA
ncbi:hypothetical protein ASE01_06870 [Nocardioides sp. Root190]|uniref:NAD-dependent epimerase/dehydratase family protein n=1 Tax=Nocardioides sp. Root190 TaxID=1736488 RepID=UPI0006FD8404|nr:NAD(P)-dependent oxidoreductase [Nocardioides sp. Root190]KRB77897.1 hypothetical protein ASE01_06870 [Nocardioides sp. Root190]